MLRPTAPAPRDVAPARGFSAHDLAALAWYGRRTVFAAVLVGLAAGAAAAIAWPRQFTATALLMPMAPDDATMRTELSLLRGADIVRGTVERLGAARIVASFRRADALERLSPTCDAASFGLAVPCAIFLVKSHLRARLDGDLDGAESGHILRLAATAPDPVFAVVMVEAAISADRDSRRTAFAIARADALAPALSAAQREAALTIAEAARTQEQAGVLDIAQSLAAATAEASAVARRDGEVRERQIAVAAELADTRQSLAASPERVLDMRETSSSDAGEDARAQLLRLRLDRAHMAAHYKRDYPGLVELDGKIAAVEATLRAQPRSIATVTRDIRNPAFTQAAARAARLGAEGLALVGQRQELDRQAGELSARADALREADTSLAALRQRQIVQEAVIRQLATTHAELAAQDSLAAARTEELRLVQSPTIEAPPWTRPGSRLALGACAGLLAGLVASLLLARRRAVYVVACEAERHLALPELARLALWHRGAIHAVPSDASRELALRVLDEIDVLGAPATIHLVGTAEHDGADLVGESLAAEIAARRGARVLLVRQGRDGQADLRSFAAHARGLPPPEDASALALFGDSLGVSTADLRARHDLVLVVSAHGVAASVTRRLSAFADLDLLVVRARHSRARGVARLCDTLASAGGRPSGFVFTDEVSPFARHA